MATPLSGMPELRWTSRERAWMLGILLLGLLVRLFRIDHQPFWLDEALTWERVHLGMSAMVTDSFSNRHMPTYFMLLQAFTHWDVNGDGWLRIPSACFGAMSAAVVYAIARRMGGRGAGMIAGLLMALSPLQVQYGQEARSYTLVTLLITVALWGLLRLAQDANRAAIDVREAGAERWGWFSYVAGTIGALDVLGDAAPWLLAANLSLLLIDRNLLHTPALRHAFRRQWWLSNGAILLCCAPFYLAILFAGDRHMLENFNWIPELSWPHLWVVAASVYLMRMSAVVKFDLLHTSVPVLGVLVALAAVAGFYRVRGKLEGRVLLLGILVLPAFILSVSLFKSMLLPRYMLWSAAPFFVLVGLGATALPRAAWSPAAFLLLMLGAINLGPVYRVETKPRWDMAAATLSAQVRPGDTVFTADVNAPTMLKVLQPKGAAPIQSQALVTAQLDQAIAHWKQGGRIWAVNGRSALGDPQQLADLKARMAALGAPAAEIKQGKEITILMFPAASERAGG